MIKAVAGAPGSQILVIGFSFGNLDKFEEQPLDTYTPIHMEDTGLPLDVVIYSGDGKRMLGTRQGRKTFMMGLTMEQIALLRQKPCEAYITLDRSVHGVSITIFAGETEAAMVGLLQKFIGPETNTTTDPRLKN